MLKTYFWMIMTFTLPSDLFLWNLNNKSYQYQSIYLCITIFHLKFSHCIGQYVLLLVIMSSHWSSVLSLVIMSSSCCFIDYYVFSLVISTVIGQHVLSLVIIVLIGHHVLSLVIMSSDWSSCPLIGHYVL